MYGKRNAEFSRLVTLHCLLCHDVNKTLPITTNIESNLLLVLPFYNVLRYHFLGTYYEYHKSFQITKEDTKNNDRMW